MQADQMKERINKIEECADDAKRAVQSGSVPQELKDCVMSLHQQASQAKHQVDGQAQMGSDAMRGTVMQMEQMADRAMQACRNAGNVDPQVQQAVQRAHDEVSRLKKDVQMEAQAH